MKTMNQTELNRQPLPVLRKGPAPAIAGRTRCARWRRRILIGLAMGALALAETDLSGKWVGGPLVISLTQNGNKLTGTAGASASEQYPLQDGVIDGDRVTFRMGAFQFDLRTDGATIKGEVKMENQTYPVILQRAEVVQTGGPFVFEVASVKLSPADGRRDSSSRLDPGRLTCTGMSLMGLLRLAYDVKSYQISGPQWLDTERYEVTAKFPAVTGFGEARQMLQTLLTERFQLAVRRESKEMPVYALVVGKDGFRLKETEMGAGGSSSAPGKLTATKMSLNQFAELLSGQLDRPVVDFTGIHGAYDFTLQWAPDTNANSDPGPAADIYVAIQQQLGLKLETRKAPVEMLIIEHANKAPVEN